MLFNNNRLAILYIFIIIIISIFIFGYYLYYKKCDILDKRYNNTNIKILDNFSNGWAFSHFILFFILTYIYPSEWLFLLICGIIWEIIEYILSLKYFKKLFKYYIDSNYDENNNYWYAQYEDIITNILGIILALLIRKIIM